jgi:hypothetical protein
VMRFLARGLFLGGLLCACSTSVGEAGYSVYTSIRQGDCKDPTDALARAYAARGLTVEECRGTAEYQIFLVSSDANSWLDVRWDHSVLSLEEDIVYQNKFGLFPNVGGSDRIEWRFDDSAHVIALIFRVVAQNPQLTEAHGGSNLSRLFVVRLKPSGGCLLGVVETNEAARTLADSRVKCPVNTAE